VRGTNLIFLLLILVNLTLILHMFSPAAHHDQGHCQPELNQDEGPR
jgi:hypothetical protein